MKKLLFPIASFSAGMICAVALIGHQTHARVPEQPDDRPMATVGFNVIQHVPIRTNNAAQDFTTPIENGLNEVVFQRHQEDSMTLAVIETDQ